MRVAEFTRLTCFAVVVSGALNCGPVAGRASPTMSMAFGEVGLVDADGSMWIDGPGGMWMDTTGAMRMDGGAGMRIGLQPADMSRMSNEHIVAHLTTGDSVEITLSQLGVTQAQNAGVRAFAQRMVAEHTQHQQMTRQMATEAGITPMPAPMDTVDVVMARRVMNRLSGVSQSPSFDRQFMGAQVMLHRHMLNALTMMRPQATGAAQRLIEQTIPVVQQHLTEAQRTSRDVGGGTGRSR